MYRILLLLALITLASCGPEQEGGALDTPTAGAITIAADESFRPLIRAQINVFTSVYRHARIDTLWEPEDEAIRDLLAEKVRLAVVSRDLTESERAVFKQQKIIPRKLKIAEDGVALIVNRTNPDSMISLPELQRVFSGQIKTWKTLNPNGSDQDIVIVFDNNYSSNVNFLLQLFRINDLKNLNVYAATSNQEVIDYVASHANAMGVIGTNWISDSDDPKQQHFVESVTVMAVARTDGVSESEYFQPYQAYLSLDLYPLRREVLVLSREARSGLGTGFMSHLASEKGQRIVLKSGLMPATMPVRIIGIKDTF